MRVKISTETFVSFSAIIIALASIVVTIWQGIEIRKHNRLSVRPRLEITYRSEKGNFGYFLTNNGLGPAILTYKKLFVDGQEVQYTGFSGFDDFINKLDISDHNVSHTGIYPGKTIKNDETVCIIRFYLKEKDDIDSLLPKIYKQVDIEIGYKSMYDESYICKVPK